VLTRLGTGSTQHLYSSQHDCCSDLTWANAHLLFFEDGQDLVRLDAMTRRVRKIEIPALHRLVLSPDRRWLAVEIDPGPLDNSRVDVLPVSLATCLAVPETPEQSDFDPAFTADSRDVLVTQASGDATRVVEKAIASLPAGC
jgi:hypothetical protein